MKTTVDEVLAARRRQAGGEAWTLVTLANDDVGRRLAPLVGHLRWRGATRLRLLLLRPAVFRACPVPQDPAALGVDELLVLERRDLRRLLRQAGDGLLVLVKQPLFSRDNLPLLGLYHGARARRKYLLRCNLLLLRACLASRRQARKERWRTCWQTVRNSTLGLAMDGLCLAFYLFILPLLLAERWHRRRISPPASPPARILVVRMDHLGDVICTLPSLAALRRRYPRAEITFLGAPWSLAPLRATSGLVDRIWSWPAPWHDKSRGFLVGPRGWLAFVRQLRRVRAAAFDLVIQPRGDSLDLCLAVFSGAGQRISGVDLRRPLARRLAVHVDEPVYHQPFRTYHIAEWASLAMAAAGAPVADEDIGGGARSFVARGEPFAELRRQGRPLAVLVVGAGGRPREWPVARFAALVDILARRGVYPVLVGGPADVPRGRAIAAAAAYPCGNLVGQTDFAALPDLLRAADFVVSPDTSVMHLASLLGKEVVAIFSSGNLDLARPCFAPAVIVQRPLGCSGCGDRCLFRHRFPCIQLVGVDAVAAAVASLASAQPSAMTSR